MRYYLAEHIRCEVFRVVKLMKQTDHNPADKHRESTAGFTNVGPCWIPIWGPWSLLLFSVIFYCLEMPLWDCQCKILTRSVAFWTTFLLQRTATSVEKSGTRKSHWLATFCALWLLFMESWSWIGHQRRAMDSDAGIRLEAEILLQKVGVLFGQRVWTLLNLDWDWNWPRHWFSMTSFLLSCLYGSTSWTIWPHTTTRTSFVRWSHQISVTWQPSAQLLTTIIVVIIIIMHP